MSHFSFEDFLYQGEDISLSKAAMLCSMVDNNQDDELVDYLADKGISAVITRAGGSGDNLKNKLLRNSFGAAENSGLISVTNKNRHAITKLIEEILRSFDSPIVNVAGGGLKIGLVVRDYDMGMAVFGTIGLAGLNVDYEISSSRVLYHCLED